MLAWNFFVAAFKPILNFNFSLELLPLMSVISTEKKQFAAEK